MDGQKNYGILRFVEQGTHCYSSSDFIRGETLAVWIQKHTHPDKEQIFLWMKEAIRQLDYFYRCKEGVCYQYVNPFGFIIGRDERLYLLDRNAEENKKLLKYMQRRTVRELFLPPGNTYYQNADETLDLHGIGRTFQYILSCSSMTPPLTGREERRFRKIISRCLIGQSKKSFQDIHEILIRIPTIKVKKRREKEEKVKKYKERRGPGAVKILLLLFVSGIVFLVLFKTLAIKKTVSAEDKTVKRTGMMSEDEPGTRRAEEKRVDTDLESETELGLELGFLYFLELEDYEKSREVFEKVARHQPMAQKYEELSVLMAKWDDEKESVLRLASILKEIESSGSAQKDRRQDLLLLRGYRLLDIREVKEEVIRIGEHFLDLSAESSANESSEAQAEGKEIEKKEWEVRVYLAEAYAEQEEKEKAAEQYEKLADLEADTEKKEVIYQRLAGLYEEAGQMEEAWASCLRGIEECSDSRSLRILYIRMQCRDPNVSSEICGESIRGLLEEMPDIVEEKEFQKLMQEYGIQVEGEQVWVEK